MKAKIDPEPSQDRVIHEIDGIAEYDNKLPNWWLYSLYASVAFAFVYWFAYHVAGFAELPLAEYQAEVVKEQAKEAARVKAEGAVTPEALTALSKDKATVEQGRQVFAQTCAACHRQDGGGVVGPNLTDDFWLHGASADRIYKTIASGVPDKGMPAWGSQLGSLRVQAVTAYVISIRGTNVGGGKAPQGERERLTLR